MGGTQYKPGALVVLYNSLLPVFGEITDILVFNVDECYFIIQEYETEYFSKHYHSYEVKMKNPSLFHAYQPNKLADYHPLCSYTIMGSLKVPLKYHIIESF